jgi:hypothetical protein
MGCATGGTKKKGPQMRPLRTSTHSTALFYPPPPELEEPELELELDELEPPDEELELEVPDPEELLEELEPDPEQQTKLCVVVFTVELPYGIVNTYCTVAPEGIPVIVWVLLLSALCVMRTVCGAPLPMV